MISVADQAHGPDVPQLRRHSESAGSTTRSFPTTPIASRRRTSPARHTFKTGWNDTFGYQEAYNYAYQPISYTFNQGVPTFVTQYAAPIHGAQRRKPRLRRVCAGQLETEPGDRHRGHQVRLVQDIVSRQQTIGPGPALVGLQNRNISFPAQDNINWKDLTYRSGAGLRPVRRRQVGGEGGSKQISARADTQRLGSCDDKPRQRHANVHHPQLGRLQRQLRRGLQPRESACAKPHGERRRQLRRRSPSPPSARPFPARRSIRIC